MLFETERRLENLFVKVLNVTEKHKFSKRLFKKVEIM